MGEDEEKVVYLKNVDHPEGEFVPESEAKISIYDSGWSWSVFTSIRSVKKTKMFKLDYHMDRLYNCLRMIEVDPGLSPEEMKEITTEQARRNAPLLAENEEHEFHVTVTPGSLPIEWEHCRAFGRPSPPDMPPRQPTVFIRNDIIDLKWYGHYYKNGVHAVLTNARLAPLESVNYQLKSFTNRWPHYFALREAIKLDQDHNVQPLMMDIYGHLGEFTGSSLWVVYNGKVMTPPVVTNILEGVSRRVVLEELCPKLGITVYEQNMSLYHLINAEESFQTATSKGIFPISWVNGRHLWQNVPGPITKRLMDAYDELLEGSISYALSLV